MNKVNLIYVEDDSWSRATFRVENTDMYVKDISLSDNIEGLDLFWSCPKNCIDGEPDYPFEPKEGTEINIIGFNPVSYEDQFNYMMLDRLVMDCEAHLGISNRKIKDVKTHIQTMKDLWNGFKAKPEWVSMKQIEEYENKISKIEVCNEI